ncbi:MAG: thioesterase family protein [Roseburia sp.]
MLETGICGEAAEQVTEQNTAEAMGSGELKVYATPAMIALMEQAAYRSVAGELEDGQGTVGTLMNVKHIASTPVGMQVTAKSVLTEVDRRRLVFTVEAYDETGKIGEGVHERFVIDNRKFQEKADAKRQA